MYVVIEFTGTEAACDGAIVHGVWASNEDAQAVVERLRWGEVQEHEVSFVPGLAAWWERAHAGTLARAALDLLDHDDPDIQAIGVDLKTISEDMKVCA